jgi:signal peptidase
MALTVRVTAGRVASVALLAVACGLALTHGLLVVLSGSMEPAVRRGDVVVYRRGVGSVAEGDLVVYARPGERMPVVHRVVRVTPEGDAITRGDANTVEDRDPLPRDGPRGRVVGVLPTAGLVTALARTTRDARLTFQSHTTTR